MNYLPILKALSISVALIVSTLHGMLEVTVTSEELPVQLRHRGYTPLHIAAYLGHADKLAQLLTQEDDALVQKKSINGSIPLHLAALQGHEGIVEALVANYPSLVDTQDNDGCTSLHYAATNGHIDVLRCLISYGANIYQDNERRHLPFHKATQNGHLDAMKILKPDLDAMKILMPDTNALIPFIGFCIDAMTGAVQSGKVEVLAFIINMLPAGCKPAPNPLMLAASYGQERLLQWYLEQEGVLIDEIDSDGRCALHHAARHGHRGVARILLARDGLLVKKRDQSFRTPLHLAAQFGHSEVIELLLHFQAEVDAQDYMGMTPLQKAATNGHTQVLQQLIVSGASVTITNTQGNTALHIAALDGQKDCVEVLLAAKSAIEAKDSSQCTPLLCAAKGGHLEVIKCLLRHGADIKYQSTEGNALVCATSSFGNEDLISHLIDNTEVELTSCCKCLPGVVPVIFCAAAWGNYKTTSLLIKKGAVLDTKLSDGRTVLHSRHYYPQPENSRSCIVRLFLRAGADMLCPDNAGVTPLDTLQLSQHQLLASKNYFQNRSLYLSGQLGPEDNIDTVFSAAAHFLDIPVLEALTDQLGDRLSTWRDSMGRNLLMAAIIFHDLDGIDWLLGLKICDLSHKDTDQRDALLLALICTHFEHKTARLSLVNKLLEAGATVTEKHLLVKQAVAQMKYS